MTLKSSNSITSSNDNVLYKPYRSLGLVCDSVPFFLNSLGSENFIVVSIGKAFQVFRTDRLQVVLVSQQCPGIITHLAARGQETYVSFDNHVVVYKRTRLIKKLFEMEGQVIGMKIVGEILLCYDDMNNIQIYNARTREFLNKIKLVGSRKITSVLHPATYINKFLFGFDDGHMELWNIRSGKLVYSFQNHVKFLSQHNSYEVNNNSSNSSISKSISLTTMTQSPSCDVIAAGFSSGDILLIHLKLDQILFQFRQQRKVTSLSFRNDTSSQQFPFLVSASDRGHMYTWLIGGGGQEVKEDTICDRSTLSSRSKLLNTNEFAHHDSIVKIEFLFGEPVVVSMGLDNALKMWIFDQQYSVDGGDGVILNAGKNGGSNISNSSEMRLLRQRVGHYKYPTSIKFYGDLSSESVWGGGGVSHSIKGLISADASGVMMFGRTEKHCHFEVMSEKNIRKGTNLKGIGLHRLPQCIGMDYTYIGARPWGNMVTIHNKHENAYVWKVDDKAITKTVLRPGSDASNTTAATKSAGGYRNNLNLLQATAVGSSSCGHYSVIGYTDGSLRKYNIQSGIVRGTFKAGVTKSVEENELDKTGHTGPITGAFIDATGTIMVSTSSDGTLCFWNFISQNLLHKINVKNPLTMLRGISESNFVATVEEKTHTVRVYDISTYRLCRVFVGGHSMEVSDVLFSLDGRRLLTSSKDSTLRVWDLPTGRCLSWLQFSAPITSIALAPNGDLYVGKENEKGIDVCVDASLTESLSFVSEPTAPTILDSLNTLPGEVPKTVFEEFEAEEMEEIYASKATTNVGVSFSTLPKSYWTTICHMELIRKRSEAHQPVSKSVVPFFLPSFDDAGKKSAVDGNPLAKETEAREKAKLLGNSKINKSKSMEKKDKKNENDLMEEEKEETQVISKISSTNYFYSQTNLSKFLSKINEKALRDPFLWSIENEKIFHYITSFSPSQVDVELRTLVPFDESVPGLKNLRSFFYALLALVGSMNSNHSSNLTKEAKKDSQIITGGGYDIVNAWLYRVLLLHSGKIVNNYSFKEVLVLLRDSLNQQGFHLQNLLQKAICLAKTCLQMQII